MPDELVEKIIKSDEINKGEGLTYTRLVTTFHSDLVVASITGLFNLRQVSWHVIRLQLRHLARHN